MCEACLMCYFLSLRHLPESYLERPMFNNWSSTWLLSAGIFFAISFQNETPDDDPMDQDDVNDEHVDVQSDFLRKMLIEVSKILFVHTHAYIYLLLCTNNLLRIQFMHS